MAFVTIQNGLYNALAQGLGLNRQTFQIIQPAAPLLAGDNRFLWNFFNNIPPRSLTQNYIASGGNQLFSNYIALMGALSPATEVDLEGDIGADNLRAFIDFVKTISPPPPINQYPDIFFGWAFLNAPDVANVGATDWAAILLDPILTGQRAVLPYLPTPAPNPTPGLPPDWLLGYDQLVAQLQNAPSFSFSLDSSTMNTDVSNTWTGGDHSGVFGLWSGSDSSESISTQFSESNFEFQLSFGNVLQFQTNAGAWYSSSTLNQAIDNPDVDPPWRSAGTLINWGNTFGDDGNMQRVAVSLLVVDTMSVFLDAETQYSTFEQQTIQNNSSAGVWPFYTTNSSGATTTTTTFDDAGGLHVENHGIPGVPVVIGGNVLPIDRFLGRTV